MKQRLAYAIASLLLAHSTLALARSDADVQALQQQLAAMASQVSATPPGSYYFQAAAQDAISAIDDAPRKERDARIDIAKQRLKILTTELRVESMQRTLHDLEDRRSQLQTSMFESAMEDMQQQVAQLTSQLQQQTQTNQQAMQDAQAQVQQAREEAQKALSQVAGRQEASLSAARQKTVQLNHKEAEITSGQSLPKSRIRHLTETFTLPATAFVPDGDLSPTGKNFVKALSAYLPLTTTAAVTIIGYGSDSASAKQRADQLHQALSVAAKSKTQFKLIGRKDPSQQRGAELLLSP